MLPAPFYDYDRWMSSASRYDRIAAVDERSLQASLNGLALGPLRYFERTGSTNDEAARWAAEGAPDLALVVADEQIAGRGRMGRCWHTPPGAALAFSLVLRPPQEGEAAPARQSATHLTALGALALADALESLYRLPAEIKWPNDVLVQRRKLAGILAEAQWQGEALQAVILGIGVNVEPEAVPDDPALNFPAASVAGCLQALAAPGEKPPTVERLELLRALLEKLLAWRLHLGSSRFLQAWEQRLAFKGEWVRVTRNDHGVAAHTLEGMVLGLDPDGALRLGDRAGRVHAIQAGEVHLRPVAE